MPILQIQAPNLAFEGAGFEKGVTPSVHLAPRGNLRSTRPPNLSDLELEKPFPTASLGTE